ncbi:hypothetical protein [Nocardia fusca]|uniref:Uncharacterized protein n=1 Tax=Nocardia fusca TaxID=941183 RepID=A0ABV3F7T5_9NOCA
MGAAGPAGRAQRPKTANTFGLARLRCSPVWGEKRRNILRNRLGGEAGNGRSIHNNDGPLLRVLVYRVKPVDRNNVSILLEPGKIRTGLSGNPFSNLRM